MAGSAHLHLKTVPRPKQVRAEQTLHRLLDAAEALIEERGLGEVSIPDIVRLAGSSVGGFYARLRDKNELLRALEERFFQEQRLRLERLTRIETWNGVPVFEIACRCMRELVQVFRERRALIRAFVARAATDDAIRGVALAFEREVADSVGSVLNARGAVHHPKPERAVPMAVSILLGSLVADLVFGAPGDPVAQMSADELAEEFARNFLGYLNFDETPWRER